jgi:hypothetical protein
MPRRNAKSDEIKRPEVSTRPGSRSGALDSGNYEFTVAVFC